MEKNFGYVLEKAQICMEFICKSAFILARIWQKSYLTDKRSSEFYVVSEQHIWISLNYKGI